MFFQIFLEILNIVFLLYIFIKFYKIKKELIKNQNLEIIKLIKTENEKLHFNYKKIKKQNKKEIKNIKQEIDKITKDIKKLKSYILDLRIYT